MEILFFGFLFVVIAETVASAKWYGTYFRNGIPVFSRHIQIRDAEPVLPTEEALTEKFKAGMMGQSLLFKSLSETDIAFREKFFEFTFFNSTPVMHGLVSLTPGRQGIEIKGHLNWSMLGFLVFFLFGITWMRGEMYKIFAPLFAGMMVLLYYVQYRRYSRVAEYLREKYEGSPSPVKSATQHP